MIKVIKSPKGEITVNLAHFQFQGKEITAKQAESIGCYNYCNLCGRVDICLPVENPTSKAWIRPI